MNRLARIFIVDDEIGAINSLRNQLPNVFPEGEVVGVAQSVATAVQGIRETTPGLVFLDVRIGSEIGFAVLDQTKDLDYEVVFTTAYSEYAISAIRYSAADYLLKPIGPIALRDCIHRLFHRKREASPKLGELSEVLNSGAQTMIVPDLSGYNVIAVSDIVRCESDNNYTFFVLANGRKLLASNPLKHYESMLPSSRFFRIHKSHLVQKNYIRRVERGEGGTVEVHGGDELPVSRRRKPMFLDWLRIE